MLLGSSHWNLTDKLQVTVCLCFFFIYNSVVCVTRVSLPFPVMQLSPWLRIPVSEILVFFFSFFFIPNSDPLRIPVLQILLATLTPPYAPRGLDFELFTLLKRRNKRSQFPSVPLAFRGIWPVSWIICLGDQASVCRSVRSSSLSFCCS